MLFNVVQGDDLMSNLMLVTGANGFVGRALCAELQQRGYPLRGAVRQTATQLLPVPTTPVGDIDADTDWSAALENVDIVIHLAARAHILEDDAADPLAEFLRVNSDGTERLARSAAAQGVKRLVYVSSIGVNGLFTGIDQKFSETDPPLPHNAYAISKWNAEQALIRVARETDLEVVILRPPLIYASDAPGNFARLLALVAKNIPLPFASVRNRRSLIYLGNMVDALITCAIHPAAAGQTYLVCDEETLSTADLLRQLAAAMGLSSRLLPCPPALLRWAGRLTGKSQALERLLGSLQINSDKIRTELGWRPPYSLQQALPATAQRYRHRPT